MKSTHHMHFCNPETERLTSGVDYFRDSKLEGMRVSFPGSEGAELTREKADIRVIDVPVQDVTCAIPIFPFPNNIRDHPNRINVGGLIKTRCLVLIDPLCRRNLVVDRAQFLRNEPVACETFHKSNLTQDACRFKHLATFTIFKATFAVAPCCTGYDESCPSNVKPVHAAS